jgi:hypothetical protein
MRKNKNKVDCEHREYTTETCIAETLFDLLESQTLPGRYKPLQARLEGLCYEDMFREIIHFLESNMYGYPHY